MTQLSPLSQQTLQRLKKVLISVQQIVKTGKSFFSRTVPQVGSNIHYTCVACKDVSTFIPSYFYKLLLIGIAAVWLYRKFYRKVQKRDQSPKKLKKFTEEQIQTDLPNDKFLQRLGPQFQVKDCLGGTGPGSRDEEGDSCVQQLSRQLYDSDDFRDIVFFQLMRSYSQSAVEEEKLARKNKKSKV